MAKPEPAPTEPGLYPGLSWDSYSAIDAVNSSTLQMFTRSALHARHEMTYRPPSTPAQAFGHAFHMFFLEPERFKETYVPAPKVQRRSTRDKQIWAEFEAQKRALGRESITDYELSQLEGMQSAVKDNALARALLDGPGVNEMGAIWKDPETGERCKLRTDRVTSYVGYTMVVDLKSADDASPKAFQKHIANFQYAEQGAFYLDGLNTLHPAERRYVFIVVEKEPPFGVACYELDPASIEVGRRRYRKHLGMYVEAKKTNVWPSYPAGLTSIGLPAWAMND